MILTCSLSVIATILLLIGLIIKVYRWQMFLQLYEKPQKKDLAKALSAGQAINYVVPFHIGTLYRIYYAGRKLKNGVALSLASIIIEHYLDLIVLTLICVGLMSVGHNVIGSVVFYCCILASLLISTLVSIRFTGKTKSMIMGFAGIFNDKIEIKILGFAWAFVALFRNIVHGISKSKLFVTTISMWVFYLASYWCITESIKSLGYDIRLRDIIDMFFGSSSIAIASVNNFNSNYVILLLFFYILTPLIAIYLYSNIAGSKTDVDNIEYKTIIPHVNDEDGLRFLELFFSGKQKREYVQSFIEANRDISIIQDYSAGSNAVTLLCMDREQTFFRKFAIGKEGAKLKEQIDWLETHQKDIPLPKILSISSQDRYCFYDMEYRESTIGFFNYIHSNPIENSWSILLNVLNDLTSNLYSFSCHATDKTINEYISQKVLKNLETIKQSELLTELLKYDVIIVNGREYKNLSQFDSILKQKYLQDIFKNDVISPIHGDLTIENIVCDILPTAGNPYYLIDPNTGNVLDSPYLDFAKLFQSLHVGYEFMMKCRTVKVSGNHVDYMMIRSSAYEELFARLKSYILEQFGEETLRSVLYHEIIHWLRLMPYKLDKIGDRAIIFYTGLIIALNDLVDGSKS